MSNWPVMHRFALARRGWQAIRRFTVLNEPREVDNVDLCIVGAGPAGLAAAIRYKQLDTSGERRVIVLDKASEVGGHTVSGAVLEPRALDELLPDWREDPPPLATPVKKSGMKMLLGKYALPLPEPPASSNSGNYIVSLSAFVRWLGEKAEEIGVEIYPGFSVGEVIYDESNKNVKGIATTDQGLDRHGKPKENFTRGMEFHAPTTLLAEGCHGSLSKQIISKFGLRNDSDPQTYGLGIKEVWEVDQANHQEGHVAHTLGFPLNTQTYGGGFQYHFGKNLVSVGLVVGLDYKNPWLSPYNEFQRMKTHPFYANVLKGGRCIAYAARALNEGGYQSIPNLCFPGGGLIGCSAGFMNVPKIKGTHTAMKSGMLAAEAAYSAATQENSEFGDYDKMLRKSWIAEELWSVRNLRPSFNYGLLPGMAYSGLEAYIFHGKIPWTLHHSITDAAITKTADKFKKIEYPKPDGVLTFDLMTSVSRTGTYHQDDEMCHLRVPDLKKHALESWPKYRGIEQRFCPAGVYEYVDDSATAKELGVPEFKINSQNCIHCKTCDIKVPEQDINWTVPEGGDGPKYTIT